MHLFYTCLLMKHEKINQITIQGHHALLKKNSTQYIHDQHQMVYLVETPEKHIYPLEYNFIRSNYYNCYNKSNNIF